MMLRIRQCSFLLLWVCVTLLLGVACLPALISRTASQRVSRFWARITLWLLKHCVGISSHIAGYSHIYDEPMIYAAKHQSAWDTFMLWNVLGTPAFVLKRELYLIPIFGWYLWRSGQIAINRRDGKKAISRMVQQAAHYAQKGRAIIIFPEGTRTKPFALPRFKMGVAHVSEALNLPVVPVALNAGKFWPKSLLSKQPGQAIIEFLPPMPPAGTAKEPWLMDLQSRVEAATTALLKRA